MTHVKFPETFDDFIVSVDSKAQIYKGEDFAAGEYFNRYDLKAANKQPKKDSKRPATNKNVHPLDDLFVGVHWATGGIQGGSCYSDSKQERFTSNEQPVSITPLVCNILIAVGKENVSFVQYSAYIETLFRKGTSTSYSDCYGNSTDYAYVAINLKELYDALKSF